ncbi:MAG: hypothetical protein Fur0046_27200 [Cyanobacteria bacterium J069]|nr:MAG: XisI protein [Cyanobacteria bacterium J069]
MDTLTALEHDRKILHRVLEEYCEFFNRNPRGTISKLIVSDDQTRYLVIDEGWIDDRRIHALIFDAEIRNNKIWLHHDGLDHGITDELVAAGVPKDHIVLAFHPPHVREHTGYAIA